MQSEPSPSSCLLGLHPRRSMKRPFTMTITKFSFQFLFTSTLSIPSINLQIQLHAMTHPIVLQRQLILKRPLPLPLQHNLVWLASNHHGDDHLELPYGICGQAGISFLVPETVVDEDFYHGLLRIVGAGGFFSFFSFLSFFSDFSDFSVWLSLLSDRSRFRSLSASSRL